MVKRARRLGRMTVGAGTLVLLALVLQVTTAAPAAAAAISVSPSSGPAGSSAVIEGGDFLPVVVVDLCWSADDCSNLGTASPSLTGSLRATITIPADAGPGTYSISACQPATGCAHASFEVTVEDTTTSSSLTTSTTTPSTTTSTGASVTTTSAPTTTSTRVQPTVTRAPASPTTTSPGPTTTSPSGATSSAPPNSAPTTTTAGATTTSNAGSSTTTLAAAAATDTTQPPFVLDLAALFSDTTIPQGVEDEPVADSVLGATALPAPPVAGGFDLPLDDKTPRAGLPIGGLGMWAGWLLLVFGAAATSIAVDELRRRRG